MSLQGQSALVPEGSSRIIPSKIRRSVSEARVAAHNEGGTMSARNLRTALIWSVALLLPLTVAGQASASEGMTIDIPYEVWTPSKMRAMLPIINPGHFHPAKAPDDPVFGAQDGEMRYVLFFPKAGFISDPMLATQNIQSAARRHGAEFISGQRVTGILQEGGRVAGVTLEDGRALRAPVVINASGPHSFKINEMAGVAEGMTSAPSATTR